MRNHLLAAAAVLFFATPALALAADPPKTPADATTTSKAKPSHDKADKADKSMPADKAKPADDSATPASDTSTAPADKSKDTTTKPDAPK